MAMKPVPRGYAHRKHLGREIRIGKSGNIVIAKDLYTNRTRALPFCDPDKKQIGFKFVHRNESVERTEEGFVTALSLPEGPTSCAHVSGVSTARAMNIPTLGIYQGNYIAQIYFPTDEEKESGFYPDVFIQLPIEDK